MSANSLEEDGRLTFSDEDFERRYSPEPELCSAPEKTGPDRPTPQAKRLAIRLHGGGNSYMRARRRRLAQSGSA